MTRVLKNYRLNLFTFIEILLAFLADIIVIALNTGYLDGKKKDLEIKGDFETLVILNTFTILAMFVTAIGIMGIQLISIYRRKKEIGLRKAVGAKDSDIFLIILGDTLQMIIVPAFIGCMIGAYVSYLIPSQLLRIKATINPVTMVWFLLSLLLFTALSGMLPAIKAIRLRPMDVLRNHASVTWKRKRKTGNIVFYVLTSAVIIACLIINYKIDADYRKDAVNTEGIPPAASQAAPAFSFQDGKGSIISSDTLAGRKYCLVIWDSDIYSSSEVLNELDKLVTDGAIRKEDIYAVNIDIPVDKTEEFIQSLKISIAPLIDNKHSTKWAFHASRLPAIYLIDENGIITNRILGWLDAEKEYLINSIEQSNAKNE